MPRRKKEKKEPKEPKEVRTTVRGKKNVVQTVVVKVGETRKRGGRKRRSGGKKADVMMRELPPPVVYQTGPSILPQITPPPAPPMPPAFGAARIAAPFEVPRVEPIVPVATGPPPMPVLEEPVPIHERVRAVKNQMRETVGMMKEDKDVPEAFNSDFGIGPIEPMAPFEFAQTPVSGHLSLLHPDNIHMNNIAISTPRGIFSEPVHFEAPSTPVIERRPKRAVIRRHTSGKVEILKEKDEPTSPQMLRFEPPAKL